MVGIGGFEPPTYAISAHCTDLLSYIPLFSKARSFVYYQFRETGYLQVELLYEPFFILHIYYIIFFEKNQIEMFSRAREDFTSHDLVHF